MKPHTSSPDGKLGEIKKPVKKPDVHWARESLQPQPEIEWIVNGLISSPSLTLVFGESGSGKTFVLLDAAVAIAQGESTWLDFEIEQRNVLLIDEESGVLRLNRRLGDIMGYHEAGDDTPLAYTSLESFNFLDDAQVNRLRDTVIETGAKVIIVDALMDVAEGANVSNLHEILPPLRKLRGLAYEMNLAIVVIHHTNKMGDYLGSTSIKGVCDLMIGITFKTDTGILELTTTKERDIARTKFAALVSFEPGNYSFAPAKVKSKPKEAEHNEHELHVINYLTEHGKSWIDDITKDTKSPETVRKAVYKLANEKVVYRTDGGNRGKKAFYDLATSKAKTPLLLGFLDVSQQAPLP